MMTYISQLKIQNFGPLEEFEYNPTRINVFVGKNNTGKTTVLRAILLAVRGRIETDRYFPFASNIRTSVKKGKTCAVIEANNEETYVFESLGTVREDLRDLVYAKLGQALDRFFEKKITPEQKIDVYGLYLDNFDFGIIVSKSKISFYPYPTEIPFKLSEYYKSFLDIIGSEGANRKSDDQIPHMSVMEAIPIDYMSEPLVAEAKSNIRYLTHYNKIQDQEFTRDEIELRKLEEYIKENNLVDNLDRLTPNTVMYTKDGGEGNEANLEQIPYNMHGDGFLTLLNTLHYLLKSEDGILLIEEPENHLHPAYLEVFVKTIFEYSQKLNVQVFMTSHSYDLIEEILEFPETDEDMKAVCINRLQRKDDTIVCYSYSVERGREVLNDLKIDLRGS